MKIAQSTNKCPSHSDASAAGAALPRQPREAEHGRAAADGRPTEIRRASCQAEWLLQSPSLSLSLSLYLDIGLSLSLSLNVYVVLHTECSAKDIQSGDLSRSSFPLLVAAGVRPSQVCCDFRSVRGLDGASPLQQCFSSRCQQNLVTGVLAYRRAGETAPRLSA